MDSIVFAQELISISSLISRANQTLDLAKQNDIASFIERVVSYIDGFDEWFKKLENSCVLTDSSKILAEEKSELFKKIAELNLLHQQVLELALQHQDQVGTLLTGIHQRSNAIKKYVDPFPERVSLTGKRKG